MEFDVTEAVCAFRQCLISAWNPVNKVSIADRTGSFLADWMQSNWERIVEASIAPEMKVVLEPYGEGADCNVGSSRVWRPDLIPTTPVYIRYIGNEPLINVIDHSDVTGELKLNQFCTIAESWPRTEAPFDYAYLEAEDLTVIAVDQLRYYINL